ncbi:MAG: shikimate dehydrogenase [Propionibacteriaceae bacterium]|jgi:shikimate dehydrogenase|nr:shikimate dehydrogenase [Propionibacteriaceae bacterium]
MMPGGGTTPRSCGVVGWPARYSLSPALHRAGYAAVGLDWAFDAYDVPPDTLAAFVAKLDDTWRGLAVTMPHKEVALTLGTPDQAAAQVGAANTLVFESDGVQVRNSDIPGALQALATRGIDAVSDAVIVGAGATSRSIVAALARIGLKRLTVLARRPEQAWGALRLAETLGVTAKAAPIGPHPGTDLLVSTLPRDAVAAYVADLVPGAGAVFDVAYHPWERPLLDAARTSGVPTIDGLDLLAGQAAIQFQLLTGCEVSFGLLREAGLAELAERGALSQ